jgi:hypothetical protein
MVSPGRDAGLLDRSRSHTPIDFLDWIGFIAFIDLIDPLEFIAFIDPHPFW